MEQPVTPTQSSPVERINKITGRWRRIRALFIQRWWILLLCVSAGLCFQAWKTSRVDDQFVSKAQLVAGGSISLKESATYREDIHNFFGTQKQVLLSGELHGRVRDRIGLLYPEIEPCGVSLIVEREKNSAVFNISANGTAGKYVQAYLSSLLEEYLNLRKEMRARASDNTLDAITKQLAKLEEQVEGDQAKLTTFLDENNVVVLQEGDNTAANFLATLNQDRARLQTEINLLRRLDIEQDIDRRKRQMAEAPDAAAGGTEASPRTPSLNLADSEKDYLRTKQEIEMFGAEKTRLSKVLKPKHPSIRSLDQQIEKSKTLLAIYRTQAEELNASRAKALEIEVANLDSEIESWESKTLETNQKLARHNHLQRQLEHSQNLHQNLLLSLHQVDQTRNIAQDSISVMERASVASLVQRSRVKPLLAGGLAGLLAGCLLLFGIDRLDDRMHSTGDYLSSFAQPLLAVIPKQPKVGKDLLIEAEDNRHMFVEAYRQLRSSLLFKDWQQDAKPKVILITSGIPFEGKSTTASNLAITLAHGGAKTLLIDADLRRGSLHEWFEVDDSRGFGDLLSGDATVEEAARPTPCDNLSIIPRGDADAKDFAPEVIAPLLDEMRSRFDFVVIDSAPVLVVDDTASLAPLVDTTLAVMRLNKTPARIGQICLNRLSERQVSIGGVILNCDEPRFANYKAYGYYQYYAPVVQAKKGGGVSA